MKNATQTHFTPLNESAKMLPTGITIAFNNFNGTSFIVRTNINGLTKTTVSQEEVIEAGDICIDATPESFMNDPDLVMEALTVLFDHHHQKDTSIEFWDFQIYQDAEKIKIELSPMNAGQLAAAHEMAAAYSNQ